MVMLKPLCWLAHLASTCVVRLLSAVCVMPMRRLVMLFSTFISSLCSFWSSALSLRAYLTAISPCGVSFNPPLLRTNSTAPSSSSSWFIWWLTAGWVSESASAAFVKFLYSTTASSVSIFVPNIAPPLQNVIAAKKTII